MTIQGQTGIHVGRGRTELAMDRVAAIDSQEQIGYRGDTRLGNCGAARWDADIFAIREYVVNIGGQCPAVDT